MNSYQLIGVIVTWSILVIGILCWGIIATKGNWLFKIAVTSLVIALTLGIVYVWREVQGTPKLVAMVEAQEFILRSYMIKEPKKGKGGQIWLWVTTKDGLEPINIAIPYSKKMHKQLTENKGLKEGRPQVMRKGKGAQTRDGEGQGDDPESDYVIEDFIPQVDKESENTPEPEEPKLDLVPGAPKIQS